MDSEYQWKIKKYPENEKATANINYEISNKQYTTLLRIHRPENMDDHWFFFIKNDILCYGRSYSGYCHYKMHFKKTITGYCIYKIEENLSEKQTGPVDKNLYNSKTLKDRATSIIKEIIKENIQYYNSSQFYK